MVLPQGFRKLLLSSTSEKAKIFQTLFGTERWQKLVSAAQSMANDLKKQADELRIGAETILKREEVSDLDALLQKQQAEQKRSEEAAAWSAACERSCAVPGKSSKARASCPNSLPCLTAAPGKRALLKPGGRGWRRCAPATGGKPAASPFPPTGAPRSRRNRTF